MLGDFVVLSSGLDGISPGDGGRDGGMGFHGRACIVLHANGLYVGGGCRGRRFGWLAVFGRWEFRKCWILCWVGLW